MASPWRTLAIAGMSSIGPGVGCGDSDGSGPRRPVSGAVKFGGESLKTGRIVFVPLRDGPAAQADIADGTYSLARSQGPGPGSYRVEIYSIQATGKRVYDPSEGGLVEETRDLIPPGYNLNSKLRVGVKPDGGNSFDFDVPPPAIRPR